MRYKQQGGNFLIRLDKSENVIESMTRFLIDNKLDNGHFIGIGAVNKIKLGFYDLKDKKYNIREYEEELEVLNLNGIVSISEGKPNIHAHITLSDKNCNAIGGHLVEAIVSITLEIAFSMNNIPAKREFNKSTGLNLLNI